MSDKDQPIDAKDQPLDLSNLNFGPAWAKDKPKGKPRARQGSARGERGERASGGGRDQRDSRKQHGGGREQRFSRGKARHGDGRRNEGKGGRDRNRKPHAPAPEGVTGRIMPIEEGLDALAKDIAATGRTHSVFDIAWMVLGALERFHVIFESEQQPLYRSKKDHSMWLYQRDCLAHFWSSGLVNQYYEEETVDVDPPAGNFQSVARCGYSGAMIGPPNHHAYQKNVLELHQQKFSNIPLDRYKSKIVMEHSEEAVQGWLDSMTKHKRWRPKAEDKAEGKTEDKETGSDAAVGEAADEAAPDAGAVASVEEVAVILDSRLEVDQHFMAHGFASEYESGKTMSVLANVPAKMIDPGLLTLLKATVSEERRYPGKLASILCRQLSGRHLAVFKWKKHLHCGPARPRKVPDDLLMAERPSELFHWVIAHPGGNIDAMWKELLPADVDDETRHLWYHDLHWLINEGIVLLFSDGKLHAAKELQKKSAKKTASKAASKTAKKSDDPKPNGKAPDESEAVTEEVSEPVKADSGACAVESEAAPSEPVSADSVVDPVADSVGEPSKDKE